MAYVKHTKKKKKKKEKKKKKRKKEKGNLEGLMFDTITLSIALKTRFHFSKENLSTYYILIQIVTNTQNNYKTNM